MLLGEQVSAPERGDGTQGSLQGREEVGRSTQEKGLSGQLPPCSLRPSLSASKPLRQPHQDPALTARSHLPPPGRPPVRRPPCHPRLLPSHRPALARTHHLHTLAGPTQVADQQLQHRLAVEQSTPARGGSGQGVGAGAARPFPSPPHPGKAGGRRARVRGRRTGGWGTGSSGEGSLFDEVLGLLSAQEGARPPCHGLDQAQLLLAVTQGHGLGPVGGMVGQSRGWLHRHQEGQGPPGQASLARWGPGRVGRHALRRGLTVPPGRWGPSWPRRGCRCLTDYPSLRSCPGCRSPGMNSESWGCCLARPSPRRPARAGVSGLEEPVTEVRPGGLRPASCPPPRDPWTRDPGKGQGGWVPSSSSRNQQQRRAGPREHPLKQGLRWDTAGLRFRSGGHSSTRHQKPGGHRTVADVRGGQAGMGAEPAQQLSNLMSHVTVIEASGRGGSGGLPDTYSTFLSKRVRGWLRNRASLTGCSSPWEEGTVEARPCPRVSLPMPHGP